MLCCERGQLLPVVLALCLASKLSCVASLNAGGGTLHSGTLSTTCGNAIATNGVVSVDDTFVILGSYSEQMCAVDLSDHSKLWSFDTETDWAGDECAEKNRVKGATIDCF